MVQVVPTRDPMTDPITARMPGAAVGDYHADCPDTKIFEFSSLGGLGKPKLGLIAKTLDPVASNDPTDDHSPVAKAEAFTRQLATSHYENFSVISLLLPRALRQDFCNIYAFCRVADDLADELGDRQQSRVALAELRKQTLAAYQNDRPLLLFAALGATIDRHEIPPEPFLNLIGAFEQDQRVNRYQTFDEVVDYCRRSADPVGRLVLYLCGYRDPQRQQLSDKTCTALQLANFWQDVRRDALERDRIYIPTDAMQAFGITESQIAEGHCTPAFAAMMKAEVDRTENLFNEGDALLPLLRGSVRRQVALFGLGGRAILGAIRRQNYDTLTSRPVVSRFQKAGLVGRVVLATLTGRLGSEAAR